MNIQIQASFLPHTHPESTLAFYRDALGFEVRSNVEYNGLHWITVGPVGQPDTSIILHPATAIPGATENEYRTIADLDGTFERLQATDAEVVQEPIEQPYGVRDCAFRDPAGNLVRIRARR